MGIVILCMSFRFIGPNTLNYLAFQSFELENTWWRLFQKRVVRTKFDIYVFIYSNKNTDIKFSANCIFLE